jgi:hypothetical protein
MCETGGIFETLLPKEADYFSKASLYTIDGGQNDLTGGYKLNMTTEHVKENDPKMLSQFSGIVKVRQAGINGSPFLYTSVNSCLYADSHLL